MTESSRTRIANIGELAAVYTGYAPRPGERKQSGEFLLIGGRNIKDGRLVTTDKDTYIENLPKASFQNAIAQPGDILVSTIFDKRKLYIYREIDMRAVVNSSCAIIRAPDTNDYIASYLRTTKGQEQFLRDATQITGASGGFIPRLSINDLLELQIPILPLEELQKLGDDHIEASSNEELITLKEQLKSRDKELAILQDELAQATAYYEDRIAKIESQISTNDLKARIAHGETARLEFKSSLRWNLRAQRDDDRMGVAVLKTIAAFCNTEGGELLIGVEDNQSIIGIEHDHFTNDDRFLLHLRNLIIDKLEPSVVRYVNYEMISLDDLSICQITCKRSSEDIWVKTDRNSPEVFYVRSGPSSTELSPRDATRYIQGHFQR